MNIHHPRFGSLLIGGPDVYTHNPRQIALGIRQDGTDEVLLNGLKLGTSSKLAEVEKTLRQLVTLLGEVLADGGIDTTSATTQPMAERRPDDQANLVNVTEVFRQHQPSLLAQFNSGGSGSFRINLIG